ncbi:methyl-accepting chemotaxis protein [Peteryoungia ipomoeae]|uniref:Methyl-accepting chemotaxis protein n=1 Tax=Peteryoungia ipomoeae TaxID=1210932 RepID=A0A4S8P808_9HYPH|nr:methyl-accepting chemotaxis protein [Peteryoungia ipomoeae]THV25665.1 methyl-accepting chemotaxis protein [Peteryoungia ipomoeae]
MQALSRLRTLAGTGIVALLWVNLVLIAARLWLRDEGADMVALLAAALVAGLATLLWVKDKTGPTTRIVTSIAQAAMVAILVFSFEGSSLQIDAHMYFFATLAICAAWIDWRAIVGYAAFVAIHHTAFYFAMPLAVFPGESHFDRVVLHAVVLVLQSAALIALAHSVVTAFIASEQAVNQAVAAERETRDMAEQVHAADIAAAQERDKRAEEKARAAEASQMVIEQLDAALSRLAAGDLSCRIEAVFPGVMDALRVSFNASIENLERVFGQVRGAVHVVSNGSSQITAANQDLSTRTERQAASVEETASALSTIMQTVRDTASIAEKVGKLVDHARQGAERSGGIVTDAVEAMSRIEASSQEINQIISVIDEIAFQTNLLALNAGVEAARAGEAGKGFAVVAQEVRELAQRSAQAAKEIKHLINSSAAQVQHGVALVDQAGDALRTIADEVNSISSEVSKIVAGAREQSTGLSEIDAALGTIDRSTQQNAAMVEESSAAATQLSGEAQRLDDLMAKFNFSASRQVLARVA